ncbi:MAG: NAD-dependent epimerase/dehydratase family protein [Solirubrobacteraceae bacterium]
MPDTVVVTGGAGFIGSHVVDALVGEGKQVIVIDDLSSGEAGRVNEEASLETVDITDPTNLDPLIDRASPTAIYHLAAQASVTASVTSPLRDCQVNVEGTLNLLEGARRSRAPLVFTSTGGALYGNDAPIPTPETFIPSPLAPYGASKWSAEAYLNTWANSSRLPHAVARLGNVYGPRQSPHGEAGVVAIFSHALWSGERPRMFGHGRPTRDYIHVADVVEAMLRAAGTRGTFNVATGIETSVKELYSVLAQAAGSSIEAERLPLREGELERSCMDPSHAQDVLAWRARIPIADGLVQTYQELIKEFEARERAGSRPSEG